MAWLGVLITRHPSLCFDSAVRTYSHHQWYYIFFALSVFSFLSYSEIVGQLGLLIGLKGAERVSIVQDQRIYCAMLGLSIKSWGKCWQGESTRLESQARVLLLYPSFGIEGKSCLELLNIIATSFSRTYWWTDDLGEEVLHLGLNMDTKYQRHGNCLCRVI